MKKRLIDANALHKRIEMNLRASNPFTIEECCYKDALNSVDEAPTIDPESLRPTAKWIYCAAHGRWCGVQVRELRTQRGFYNIRPAHGTCLLLPLRVQNGGCDE